MKILSLLFEAPQTRMHRKAAEAAMLLRKQAARDLFVEVDVLLKLYNLSTTRQQQAYASGNVDLASRYVLALAGPTELVQRIERVGPELENEISARKAAASSAADWESYASFEIELREGFIKMRAQVKEYTTTLTKLNVEVDAARSV